MSIKMIFASAAALAMAAGTPALAAKDQNRQAMATDSGGGAGVESKGERKICKYIDATESRMKRERLCYTKDEWKKFEDAQQ